jgi:hypothetical protein
MRWRVLMNSLERSGSRDVLERLSLAIEQLGPIMAGLLLIPSAVLLAGAGAYSGWSLAQGTLQTLPFDVIRFLLFAACGLTLVGPLFLPAADRTHAVRLLLLPISRHTLYTAQTLTAITDPWILLVVPTIAAVPLGMAAGGAPGAGATAAAAGLLLVVVLLGISSNVSSLLQLLVRDRRRSELLTLLFILILPVIGMLPALLDSESRHAPVQGAAVPAWILLLERRALPLVPSEMYVRTTRAPIEGSAADGVTSMLELAAAAVLVHLAAFLLFQRFLDSPGSRISVRRHGAKGRSRDWKIPGFSAETLAVTSAHIRLILRTPRGRSTLLSPMMVFAVFAAMMWRGSAAEFSFVPLGSGVALATFGSFMSLLAILPLAMNQFAIDGAGLTLEFLSPIEDRHLLRGKAMGNAVIAAVPMLICTLIAAFLFPSGGAAAWASIPIGVAATYLLIAPVAAVLSAVLPRAVDLNSVGRGSNAHGAATLLGLVATIVAGGLTLGVCLAIKRFGVPPYVAVMLTVMWLVLCTASARLLFIPARAVLSRRRENLALLR